ncbi:MAG: glycosyltransferase [Bacteroidales bacterium]|nr:glycosyltransferase [Bacteroidales bacterium]MCF8350610.1 glycosyltransferase [Bacteroidales bacterium]MCF8377157.1 glycosyltransferase [Bacteroidales bacterium]
MDKPRISVIIPVFNVEDVIGGALDSIVKQTYENIEVWVVDGASTDATLSVIDKYREDYPFINVVSEKDEGIYDAMNKGIDLSSGDWLYFMGADDRLFDEEVLLNLYKSGALNQVKVVYGNVLIVGGNPWAKDQDVYDGLFDLEKLLNKNICQQAIFYPRKVIAKAGYFDKRYTVTADWDYNLRCFARQQFLYVDLIIAKFYSGGLSSQDDNHGMTFREMAENVVEYFEIDPDDPKYVQPGSPFRKFIAHYNFVRKTQLNPNTNQIEKGISLCTAIKNRAEIFEDALKTWVKHDEIDEIIIVDWTSDESLLQLVQKYQNGKIFLARVENQKKWILAPAFNLAARLTSKDKILKLDADVKLLPGFFQKHELKQGMFYSGDWRKARNENETHLNGNLFLFRADFFKVNGYNEFFKTYGWDDSDLFSRLESSGLNRQCFDYDTLHHIDHQGRMAFQSPSKKLKNLSDEEWSRLNIFISRYISKKVAPWSVNKGMLNFEVSRKDDCLIQCWQQGEDENIIPEALMREAEIEAIKERLKELRISLPDKIEENLTNEDYILLFNLHLSEAASEQNSKIFSFIQRMLSSFSDMEELKDEELEAITAKLKAQQEEQNKARSQTELLLQEKQHYLVKINQLEKELESKKLNMAKLNAQLKNLNSLSDELRKEIEEKSFKINNLKLHLKDKDQLNQEVRRQLDNARISIHGNQKQINILRSQAKALRKQLKDIHASYTWKIGRLIISPVYWLIKMFIRRKQQL